MDDTKIYDCYPEENSPGNCPDGGVVGPDEPTTSPSDPNNSCSPGGNLRGLPCVDTEPCYPWQLTNFDEEVCAIDGYVEESIAIGGAQVNIHKMLGIYEQEKLVDETGVGEAISGGDHPNFPADDAFNKFDTEWRSLQTGKDVVRKAYIGYDFGPIRLDNGRIRYAIETYVKRNIATIRIKQGCDSKNRVTKVRVERSPDGEKWYGVSLLSIPDCDGYVTIHLKASVPSRYWRIRPAEFNGGDEDCWAVKAVQLSEYEKTNVENIQDKIFLENRDRQYTEESIVLKGTYAPVDYAGFLAKMGFNSGYYNGEQYLFEFSFTALVRALGRPIVIGDILQLPSETYYDAKMQPTLKYLEVTNVSWSSAGFTPQWVPTMIRVVAEPAIASQETQDIFGKLTEDRDSLGTVDINDGNKKKYQDVHDIDQTVEADANTQVPQRGQDFANKQVISNDLKDWIQRELPGVDPNKIDASVFRWGMDALPPNGEDYTEGDNFPTNPKNGDYHRKTYNDIDRNLAPRLYRYSSRKKRWLYLSTDVRYKLRQTKPVLTDFLNPDSEDGSIDPRADVDKIEEKLKKDISKE